MRLSVVSLVFTAIVYAGIGIASWIAPYWVASGVQIELPTPTSVTDFRATYGGFCLAVGVWLLLCAKQQRHHVIGLWFQAISFVGFGGARLFGLLTEGGPQPMNWTLLSCEVAGLALALWCLSRERRATPAA